MITLTPEEERVRNILIETAIHHSLITYGELIRKANLKLDMSMPYDRKKLGDILGNVSEYEHDEHRPLLSCLAVSREYEHSQGFYNRAESLGYHATDWEKFACNEMKKVYKYWGQHK